MTHLLVTNDFPPKVGGIQSYLYELWRRLPTERFAVLTIDHGEAASFDAAQNFRIRRLRQSMLLPTRRLRDEIDHYAGEVGATHIVLDPALPIGLIGPQLSLPYSLVLHGAEIAIPARFPVTRQLLQRALSHAELLLAAGGYPAHEARRLLGSKTPPIVIVPPGVDVVRFHPLDDELRCSTRDRLGISNDALLVVSVSRLVPRKGMDVLIKAAGRLSDTCSNLVVVIGGVGRDRKRLEHLVDKYRAPVRFLGRVGDEDLPGLYGSADIAAMCCRNRWLGLEQEGFGIVFLEAAASGTAVLAGASGGASEAVLDGVTGLVVDHPSDARAVHEALLSLLVNRSLRDRFGESGRERIVRNFDYDLLADRLDRALARAEAGLEIETTETL